MRLRPRLGRFARLSWIALLYLGCADPAGREAGSTALIVRADLSATAAVATVVVEVTATDLPAPLVFNLPVTGGVASGSISLPTGAARTVTLTAYDQGGVQTHRGGRTIDIVPGANPAISIVLAPLGGNIPIVVTLASFSVVVTPTVHLVATGATLALAATVRDAQGTSVPDPIAWGSLATSVATVTATGPQTATVSAVGAGVATIVATYGGAAGASTITVSVPANPRLQPLATGLTAALFATAPPDDTLRLFIVQQDGIIRVMRRDTMLAAPFLDLTGLTVRTGERGLLGMAFHPAFAANGRFYVFYTDASGTMTVARYHESSANPNVADPTSAQVILAIPHATYANHNGGMLAFGPDGYLYIGTGDGGGGGDPLLNGQDSTSLLGKILRIDVNGAAPYSVPATNPFVGRPPAAPEVWAYGLRNPWRFSFDRLTGDLYIADVGEGSWEEIDYAPSPLEGGRNYGWRTMEGSHCFAPASGCVTAGLVFPVFEYDHTNGCSVTGGYVYRGTRLPGLYGRYLFADFCRGWVRSLRIASGAAIDVQLHTPAIGSPSYITSFGQDARGEIYLVTSGTVYRFVPE